MSRICIVMRYIVISSLQPPSPFSYSSSFFSLFAPLILCVFFWIFPRYCACPKECCERIVGCQCKSGICGPLCFCRVLGRYVCASILIKPFLCCNVTVDKLAWYFIQTIMIYIHAMIVLFTGTDQLKRTLSLSFNLFFFSDDLKHIRISSCISIIPIWLETIFVFSFHLFFPFFLFSCPLLVLFMFVFYN